MKPNRPINQSPVDGAAAEKKAKAAAACARYRSRNRGKAAARARDYYSKHREECKAKSRAYHKRNRERYRKLGREWVERNKEKVRERNKTKYRAARKRGNYAYYHRNRDRITAKLRAYYAEHPDEMRAKQRKLNSPERNSGNSVKRRARNRGVPGSHTNEEWKSLCNAFGNRCVCCGSYGNLTRDHVIPLTKQGSSNFISNIQPLCKPCNCSKHNNNSVDYRIHPFTRTGQNVLFS